MTRDKDAAALIAKIEAWLETPNALLMDRSRREILEDLIVDAIDRLRSAEKAKARKLAFRERGKDLMLFAAVLTLLSPLLLRLAAAFGVTISW